MRGISNFDGCQLLQNVQDLLALCRIDDKQQKSATSSSTQLAAVGTRINGRVVPFIDLRRAYGIGKLAFEFPVLIQDVADFFGLT